MTRELLLLGAGHLVLTGLPGLAAALLAARLGVQSVPALLALFLVVCGGVGMLGFWTYFGDRVLGEAFAYFVAFGSVLLCAVCVRRGLERSLLGALATPLGLWALGSLFLLMLGFVHGGTESPLATSARRFSQPLPGDNVLPAFFADWIFAHGHRGTPPLQPGDWHFSDRPPLQSGFVVLQRTFRWDPGYLHYQVIGVVLQQLWIVGLWALLLAAKVGRVTRGLAMIAVLLSGLVFVNGLFVWPKLLPAAMLLGAAALVLSPLWENARVNPRAATLIGSLCALAMLAHGASVFGILALAAVAAWRSLPGWRWLGVSALVGIVLLGPWSAYQRFEDPPGNRLLKWQLAGALAIDDRGVAETILDSYRDAGLGGALDNKLNNFEAMIGGRHAYESLKAGANTGSFEGFVGTVRTVAFLNLLPSIGPLVVGLCVFALWHRRARRRPAEWRLARDALVTVACGALLWGLLMFGGQDSVATIHVGSYLLPILLMVAGVSSMRAAFPRAAIGLVAVTAILSLVIYVPSFEPPLDSSVSIPAATAAAVALAGFVGVSMLARSKDEFELSGPTDAPGVAASA